MILTIRTDNPQAEIGIYGSHNKSAYEKWQAHRQLAETIHAKIKQLLKSQDKELGNITGIVVFEGPGSFTGLRIGISVANAIAYGLHIPITAQTGEDWIKKGIARLEKDPSFIPVIPEYGAPVHITKQRK
jgi:tRNA threonylcarbamoyladenosine biosynthesis protein TsaB